MLWADDRGVRSGAPGAIMSDWLAMPDHWGIQPLSGPPRGIPWNRWISFLLILVLASGCAPLTIPLPAPKDTPAASSQSEGTVVLPPVIDQRSVKHRIGMIKDVMGNDRRDLISEPDPADWFHTRVEAALRAAGYNVIPEPEGMSAPMLRIHLIKFFSESVLSNQMTKVDFETDIAFQAVVTRPDGLEAERRYYEKGERELYIVTDLPGAYAASIQQAADKLAKRIADDLIRLQNRYPAIKATP